MRSRLLYPVLLVLTASLTAVVLGPRWSDRPVPAATDAGTGGSAGAAGAGGQGGEAPPDAGAEPPMETAPAAPPDPSWVRRNPDSAEMCPPGMLLIDGIYCPFVAHRCLEFAIEERDVCDKYAAEVMCEGALKHLRFCVDEYEYPNLSGVEPVVMVDWGDAKRACEVEGKRLCQVREWEFACEGPQMWPHPYGINRDAEACNIDQHYPHPDLQAFDHPFRISEEVDRLDQRVRSGERPGCVSPFGVRDMTGNVDEWVDNPNGTREEKPFRSSLKGGYWGPIRARCRPITSSHNEWFRFYQVGFRCCADAAGGPPDPADKRGAGGWKPLPRP